MNPMIPQKDRAFATASATVTDCRAAAPTSEVAHAQQRLDDALSSLQSKVGTLAARLAPVRMEAHEHGKCAQTPEPHFSSQVAVSIDQSALRAFDLSDAVQLLLDELAV